MGEGTPSNFPKAQDHIFNLYCLVKKLIMIDVVRL